MTEKLETPAGEIDWRAFTPEDSPKTPMDVMADPQHQDLSSAKVSVGEQAFDFSLDLHDFSEGVEQKTGRSFNLLEVASEKPVALVFGSYT
jgi:hypothetical protein